MSENELTSTVELAKADGHRMPSATEMKGFGVWLKTEDMGRQIRINQVGKSSNCSCAA